MSNFWLVSAAPWAGGPDYFMVQNTYSCKQHKLEKTQNFKSIGSFILDGNIPDWETNVRHVVIDDVSNGNEYVRLYTVSWILLF